MAYVAPTVRSAGDAVTAADYNIMANNAIALRAVDTNVQSTFVNSVSFSTSSTSFVDLTGLSVTITPSTNTSKILIFWKLLGHNSDNVWRVRLLRGATAISEANDGTSGLTTVNSGGTSAGVNVNGNFLDSPATTSATTYKIQVSTAGSGTLWINRRAADISYQGSSVLTVMEVLV